MQSQAILKLRYQTLLSRLALVKAQIRHETGLEHTIGSFLEEDNKPFRRDPNRRLTKEELAWFHSAFQEAHQSLSKPVESLDGEFEADEPIWKRKLKTKQFEDYPRIISSFSQRFVIGSCTSRYKIQDTFCPLVERGCPGLVLDRFCLKFLPIEASSKIPSNFVPVIFNEHLYFLDLNDLKKVKYNKQKDQIDLF